MLRCPECRTRRVDPAAMAAHRLKCVRPLCNCEGVPFQGGLAKHRPGTIGCDHHPFAGLHRAQRRGEPDHVLTDIEARIRASLPGPDCPF